MKYIFFDWTNIYYAPQGSWAVSGVGLSKFILFLPLTHTQASLSPFMVLVSNNGMLWGSHELTSVWQLEQGEQSLSQGQLSVYVCFYYLCSQVTLNNPEKDLEGNESYTYV